MLIRIGGVGVLFLHIPSNNTGFTKAFHRGHDEYVCLDIIFGTIPCLLQYLLWARRISATLVSRLVLNLRERNSTAVDLPTTIETEEEFWAALPAAGPVTSTWELSSACMD
jgi:hypothetical protein